MLERFSRGLGANGTRPGTEDAGRTSAALRLVTAELLLATAIDAAVRQFPGNPPQGADGPRQLRALSLAPIVIAPLAAAAHLAHVRDPRVGTARALRLLNSATLALGVASIALGTIGARQEPRRLGPFGLTSAALLGFAIDSHERDVRRDQEELRRRANIVERLVPKRKPRLDRVVVHV